MIFQFTRFANRLLVVFAAMVVLLTVNCAHAGVPVTNTPHATTSERCCSVIELRQYTTEPGTRDALIALFDREFVESQEALGMRVVAQFRDAKNPDRFVWIRGFPDMPARGKSLTAFYGGPVWQTHRTAANPMIADAANVLLLRPVDAGAEFSTAMPVRPAVGAASLPVSRIVATIYYLNAAVDANFLRFFEEQIKPVMTSTAAAPIAVFQTETAENNFPKLPVRSGEHVLVWFSMLVNAEQFRDHERQLSQSKNWNDKVLPELRKYLKSPPEQLMLEPTARSRLR